MGKLELTENENGDIIANYTNELYIQILEDKEKAVVEKIRQYAYEKGITVEILSAERIKKLLELGMKKFDNYISKDELKNRLKEIKATRDFYMNDYKQSLKIIDFLNSQISLFEKLIWGNKPLKKK